MKQRAFDVLARIKSPSAVAGCQAGDHGLSARSSRQPEGTRPRRARRSSDIDVIELNEAFAVPGARLRMQRTLGIDLESTCQSSTAAPLAIGHPLGATGARITGKVSADPPKREDKRKCGLATQCIGGGQGIATVLEAV